MSDNKPAVVPQRSTLAEMQTMANAVARSGLFADIRTPEAALALMLICESEGLHPMRAMQTFHIIKGKPSKRADAILAEFQARGGVVDWHQMDNVKCDATFEGPGIKKPLRLAWTIDDARNAGLTSDTWKKFPRSMLRARVISEGVRAVMPGVIAGFYTPEEVSDWSDERLGVQQPATTQPAPRVERADKPAPVQPGSVWDQFKPEPPVDADFEDIAMPMAQPAAELTMPGDVCIRVPEEIASKSRKLSGIAFDAQSEDELKATINELDRMAQGAKSPHNRGVLTVVATFAKQALAARQMPVAP